MKKIFTVLMTLLLTFTLVGCGKKTVKGKWYYDGSYLKITDNKMIGYSEDGEEQETADIVITDEKIILSIYDNNLELGYKLSEDGKTLILSYPGDDDIYFTRVE